MNLAEPTIGDLIDRLSVLALRGGEYVLPEFEQLEEKLGERLAKYPGTLPRTTMLVLAAKLGAINGRLWEIHERPENYSLSYAAELNKERRRLVTSLGSL